MDQHWDRLPKHLQVDNVYLVFIAVHDEKGATIAPGVDNPPRGQGVPVIVGAWSKENPNVETATNSSTVYWEVVEARRLARKAPREVYDEDYEPKRSLGFREEFDS